MFFDFCNLPLFLLVLQAILLSIIKLKKLEFTKLVLYLELTSDEDS